MNSDHTWRGCVFIGTSLDGYIAKADGDLAWLTDPEPRPHAAEQTSHPALVWETFFPTVDVLVLGRGTYAAVLGFDSWPFAGKDVVVLSSTLPQSDPRVTVVRTLDEARRLLDERQAKRVYVDGGQTIRTFLAAGLVDEITLSIAPVILGGGVRLFGETNRDVLLTLRGHHSTADDGLLRVTYDVHRD